MAKLPQGATIVGNVNAAQPVTLPEGAVVIGREQSPQDYITGLIDQFTQGAVAGFGDEITALESAVLGRQPGGSTFDLFNYDVPFSERFARALEAERNQQERFREENPVTATAANIAGSVAGPLAALRGVNALRGTAAATAPVTTGQAIKAGAVGGAISGAGEAEGGAASRAAGAATGAVTGAATAGTLKKIIDAAGGVANFVQNLVMSQRGQQQAGAGRVLRELEAAGITPEEAINRLRSGEVLGQQDSTLMDLTRSVARQPGPNRNMINDALEQGFQRNQAETLESTRRALGAEANFYKWRDAFAKKRGDRAAREYAKAFREEYVLPTEAAERVNALSQRLPSSALREAKEQARIEGVPFRQNIISTMEDGELRLTRVPNLQEAEMIRRGARDAAGEAYRAGRGGAGAAISGIEKEIKGILDQSSMPLKRARSNYATASQIMEAGEAGRGFLNAPLELVEYTIDDYSPDQIQAAAKGFSSALRERVERGQINRDVIKTQFGTPRAQQIFKKLFQGDTKEYNKFISGLEKRSEFNRLRSTVQGNTRTQKDLADEKALLQGNLVDAAVSAGRGDLVGAVSNLAAKVLRRRVNSAKNVPDESLNTVAEILVSEDPERISKLLTLAEKGDKSAIDVLNGRVSRALAMSAGIQGGTVPSGLVNEMFETVGTP